MNKLYLFQRLGDREYKYDQTLLKIFGYGENKKIKLVRMNFLKTKGIEKEDTKPIESVRGTINKNKIEESYLRSRTKIFELAFCNPWDWFFTGTINPNKQDRTDLNLFHKQLTQWIRDYNKKYNLSIKFLLVPERHKDGKSWHIHGLLYGLPLTHLAQFKIGDPMGKGLADKVQNGEIIYNWIAYFNRFGFCDLEAIQNHEAVSKYLTKYITKELTRNVCELNAHTYYHSRGLKFADLKKKGSMNWKGLQPGFENDYCSILWLDYTEETYKNILNRYIN